eukprot:jgi/Chlat1/7092/Chrsp57S00531
MFVCTARPCLQPWRIHTRLRPPQLPVLSSCKHPVAVATSGATESQTARNNSTHTTIASRTCVETEVKRSRFITHAAAVDAESAAFKFFDEVRDPSASHNCWAYKIGGSYRFSDDGEPGGTAGRPILSAIEGESLDHVAVLVVRLRAPIEYVGTMYQLLLAHGAEKSDEQYSTDDSRGVVTMTLQVEVEAVAALQDALKNGTSGLGTVTPI